MDAAIYASIHLHVNMVHQEMFQHDPAEALCRAFRVTDERFVQKAAREVRGSKSINPYILPVSEGGSKHSPGPAQSCPCTGPHWWLSVHSFTSHKNVSSCFSQHPASLKDAAAVPTLTC